MMVVVAPVVHVGQRLVGTTTAMPAAILEVVIGSEVGRRRQGKGCRGGGRGDAASAGCSGGGGLLGGDGCRAVDAREHT